MFNQQNTLSCRVALNICGQTFAPKKEGYQRGKHTESKCSLSAFLRFHPWINWLEKIFWNLCCLMGRRGPCIFDARSLPWSLRGAEILVCRSPGRNIQEGKIVPREAHLPLEWRGQLRNILLRVTVCLIGIKRWLSHVCRIWFIWPWHLNP